MFYEDDGIMVAQFGTGDILVVPGVVDNLGAGSVSLVDNCGKCMPINQGFMSDEEWVEFAKTKGIKTDVDMNTVIRLVFTHPDSIDCLIGALEEAKKRISYCKICGGSGYVSDQGEAIDCPACKPTTERV